MYSSNRKCSVERERSLSNNRILSLNRESVYDGQVRDEFVPMMEDLYPSQKQPTNIKKGFFAAINNVLGGGQQQFVNVI